MKKIFFSIAIMAMSAITAVAQTTAKFSAVVKEVKTPQGVEATYKDGSTKSFEKTTSSEVSFEDKLDVLNGEKLAVKPTYRRTDGTLRHCVSITLGGGALMTTKANLHPLATGRISYETTHAIFSLAGQYTQANYPALAEISSEKRYSVFNAVADAEWKFIQNSTQQNYLAVGGEVGYGFQRTDAQESTADSHNYGLIAGAFLQGRIALNHQFGLVARAGYRLIPYVEHNMGNQSSSHGGGYIEVGLNIKFRQQPVKAK